MHPTSTNDEAQFIVKAIKLLVENLDQWQQQYRFDPMAGDFKPLVPAPVLPNLNEFVACPNKGFFHKLLG
ncbi:hypothetical protein QX776_10100 [Alteromonadaceae bacterium BrNp21-10]|nr:hypothetical protein [Alteromonadaceae bacterium BrNp21-10]